MKALFLNIIFSAIRRIVTPELFGLILKLVTIASGSDLPGPQKKAAVLAQLALVEGNLANNIKGVASWILSMAVDIAVSEVKKAQGKLV